MSRRPWSRTEVAAALAALAAGESLAVVAARMARTPRAVSSMRQRQGAPPRIARKPWRTPQIREMKAALAAGESLATVAARMGRTEEAVKAMARRMGVSRG